jgi:AraC family transcriptional regulator
MRSDNADRLRQMIDAITASLDESKNCDQLADRAYLSRFHFQRLIKAALKESPHQFRRRLLLERAAFQLATTEVSVTEIAFDAGYEALEPFSRTFAKAFGMPPSQYRRSGLKTFRLEAANGVHFHPPAALLMQDPTQGEKNMDLTDRMIEHDYWLTSRLLEGALRLPDDALDRPLRPGNAPVDLECPAEESTLRTVLERMVVTKEIWIAAIEGRGFEPTNDRSISGLIARHESAGRELIAIVKRIREQGEWNNAFVDALCEPPVSFTLGSVIAHILTFAAQRRSTAISMLRELGIDEVSYGDPITWEQEHLTRA